MNIRFRCENRDAIRWETKDEQSAMIDAATAIHPTLIGIAPSNVLDLYLIRQMSLLNVLPMQG